MMIGTVMFLGGFCASLLAFYGRNAPLLMLSVVLFSFCWVGHEKVHKAFRILPMVIISVLGVLNWQMAYFYLGNNYLHGYALLLCLLMSVFLIISLIPEQ